MTLVALPSERDTIMGDCKYCWQRNLEKGTPHRYECPGLLIEQLEVQLDKDVQLSVSRYKRIQELEAAIRDNPCRTLAAQETPYRDCFPAEPCVPCHCGKSLLGAPVEDSPK